MSADSKAAGPSIPQAVYSGPGLAEWVLGGFCTAMIAETINSRSSMEMPQTAAYYYAQNSWVHVLQWGQVAACGLVILLVLAWIIGQRTESPLRVPVIATAVLGAALIWAEILLARSTQPSRLFHLAELPYHPVASWGMLGAQVFLSYLVFKLPDGRLSLWKGLLLKAGFALCVWMVQLSAWSLIERS